MVWGQCSEVAVADTLVMGGVWRVLVFCLWPAAGLRPQQTVVLVLGVFFPSQGCLASLHIDPPPRCSVGLS